ncbi:MAG TPA: tRNA (adenosine(37)-N6)-dimethylallyltransferase MiaA [Chthoniobacterales bacterium]|nr:tRNA (adenosine(37)-N6)-dimethylallyltransferase MiaA [Chthoniobacterales bacterium]
MRGVFFIVGPTATGKSKLAADVAREVDAEIIGADAFQIYRGFALLTAKPNAATLAIAPHHLIGTKSISEGMNAEKFRKLALQTISEIHSRGKLAIVVGGSGLYVKALTHGLPSLPEADPHLRAKLNKLSLEELRQRLLDFDPESTCKVDLKNRRRVVRALEICLLTEKPASQQQTKWSPGVRSEGVFVLRDRDELYERINRRVETMFDLGVIEEVRATGALSETASKMIGLREIRDLLNGKMSILQCVAAIQQATRRYAKRQLTWFRRQTNFQPLNLSLLTHNEARISLRARLARAHGND